MNCSAGLDANAALLSGDDLEGVSDDSPNAADDWPQSIKLSQKFPSSYIREIKSTDWTPPDIARQKRKDAFYKLHCASLLLREGDTLVFIDYPKALSDGKKMVDCDGIPFRSQELRVHSEKLLATGSSKFSEFLRPTYQFRVQRRRKLVNKLPEGVKYVLDLTPPSEGDELVFQLTEVSLTPGIIKWWMSSKLHDVNYWMVKGHDDVCPCKTDDEPASEDAFAGTLSGTSYVDASGAGQVSVPPKLHELERMKAARQEQLYAYPKYYDIPDYCPVRHRNSIICLLSIIEDNDFVYDSASRLWTVLGVAKIFDCAKILATSITRWMLHGANSRFIEILPEEALRIGFAIENVEITHCAFRILVNEFALREARDPSTARASDKFTVFGRRLGDAGDDLNNLIQHAARTFIERTSRLMADLQAKDLFDSWNLEEWNRLRDIENALKNIDTSRSKVALNSLHEVKKALRFAVSSAVDKVVASENFPCYSSYRGMDIDRVTYAQDAKSFVLIKDVMKNLNPLQRFFTPFPYNELGTTWDNTLFLDQWGNYGSNLSIVEMELQLRLHLMQLEQDGQAKANADLTDWQTIFGTHTIRDESPKLRGIDLGRLESQVRKYLQPITLSWLRHSIDPPLNISRHLLLVLTHEEMKFLPLWAGGNNDGTGGVFENYLPPAEFGPNGPGPSYHTGGTVPSAASSLSGSFVLDMSGMDVKGSATAASVDVHDSISTVYRSDRVIADDKSLASSDEFTVANSDDYQEAKLAVSDEDERAKSELDDLLLDDTSDVDSSSTVTDHDFQSDAEMSDSDWNGNDVMITKTDPPKKNTLLA